MSYSSAQELLLSLSFELRTSAVNIQAAAQLLITRESISGDAEAAFLTEAVETSNKQLLGIISNSALRFRTQSRVDRCSPSLRFSQSSRRAVWSTLSCAS